MSREFETKTALVTGGGSGIGRQVALRLAAEGANVVVADVNEEAAREVAQDITEAGGQAVAVGTDVAKHQDVKRAVDTAVATYGRLDLAFNNAGINGPTGRLTDISIEDYDQTIAINQNSVFYGMYYEIPEMLKNGGGAIVNTSSVAGVLGFDTIVPYTASKHAIVGLTKAAALGYADQGIRVNSVHPAFIKTPLLTSNAFDDDRPALIAKHPVGRLGEMDEVADVVLFLLSDRSSFVTGSQYLVDGGYTIQ